MWWLLDPRLIFFLLSAPVAAWLLVRYYRKAPHPKMRPKAGEMALLALLALFFCGGGSLLLGILMADPDQFVIKDGKIPGLNVGPSGGSVGGMGEEEGAEPSNPFARQPIDLLPKRD